MNTVTRRGLCLASAFISATLACLPAHAASVEAARNLSALPTAGSATIELSLAAASSPAAFTETSRAESAALFAVTADGFSPSADAPVSVPEALPEAPMPVRVDAPAFMFQASNTGTAPKYAIVIPSGWSAHSLSPGDKVVLGIRNLANVEALAGTVTSAGYSHLVNGEPNYGTDGDAFAQRFGAGVARSASQDIFTNSILAPLLREDPRYYVEGSQYGFFHRVLYAVTRPLITRTDGGHTTVNAAMLIGYAGAAAMTPLYYPPANRNFHDVAATYGSSIGGAAIGFGVSEFSDQLLKAIHLKH